MTESPTVSVIIPTYNRYKFLGEAIQSVLDQTFASYEIIVVDDGSSDDSRSLVKRFAEQSDRIHYHYQDNQGVSVARNFGISKAKGKYIAFLDSDDLFLSTKLEKQAKYLQENPAVGMVYSSFITIDEHSNYTATHTANASGYIYRELLYNCKIATPTVMLKRYVLDKIGGFDTSMILAEDIDLWIRVAEHFEIQAITEPLIKVREFPGNTFRDHKQILYSFTRIADKHFGKPNKFGTIFKRRVYANVHYYAGSMCLSHSPDEMSQAYRYFLRGFRYFPFELRGCMLASRLIFRTLIPQSLQHIVRRYWRKLLQPD
jgi:glycosyltransferase involved in cell wall biosynthesis